jgi:hypothetical protein
LNSVAGRVQVDFRSEEPLYLQIARQIEELVGIGTLQVGDQLPTVREMAALTGCWTNRGSFPRKGEEEPIYGKNRLRKRGIC